MSVADTSDDVITDDQHYIFEKISKVITLHEKFTNPNYLHMQCDLELLRFVVLLDDDFEYLIYMILIKSNSQTAVKATLLATRAESTTSNLPHQQHHSK